MGNIIDIEAWEDLFYRAQFRRALTAMEVVCGRTDLPAAFYLLRANVLFEINETSQAEKAIDDAVAAADHSARDEHRYALARLAYMNGQYQQARTLFSHIFEDTDNERMRFKAMLGIANAYANQGKWEHVGYLVDDLASFDLTRDDDKICVLHFFAMYKSRGLGEHFKARQHYHQAMKIAARHNWNYWIIRGLYGLAVIAKKEKRASELASTLNILSSFVEAAEAHYLGHMIKKEFEGLFKVDAAVEFDSENMRMMLKDKWISFNDKPKLYHFLELLHMRGQFVKKRSIAETLWPEESYIPGVHDPRIFDIAKRVRALMQQTACDPLTLLSGRQGYKLAIGA